MFLIAKTFFPRSSVPQAAKAFTQLPKIPATVKRQGPYFHFDDENSVQTISLYSFSSFQVGNEEKKFVESRLRVFSDVPGFSYTLESWLSMEEALLKVKNKG